MTAADVRTAAQTQLAKRDEPQQPSIAQFITRMTPEIARAVPTHIKPDRVARIALTAVRKNPKLAECTPESFAGALLTASAMGLEPGTEEAWLVPYKDKRTQRLECTLIVGYQGFAKLFFQSPLAKHLDAHVVYEGDTFDYAYGLNPYLTHKPAPYKQRGDIIAYYAAATLTNGATAFVVISPEEAQELRGGKIGPDARFAAGDPMHWMERKTALRQLVKLLPRSAELNRALDTDETSGRELHAELVASRQDVDELDVDTFTGEIVEHQPELPA